MTGTMMSGSGKTMFVCEPVHLSSSIHRQTLPPELLTTKYPLTPVHGVSVSVYVCAVVSVSVSVYVCVCIYINILYIYLISFWWSYHSGGCSRRICARSWLARHPATIEITGSSGGSSHLNPKP